MKKGDHLFLVDGSAYIFRAYHALPPLTRKSDGLPMGAVSGFCNMLWKLLQEARDTSVGVVPTHFAVIFDYSSTTFRNEIYPEYKANRDAPPEDLRPQFGLIRQATQAFNVPCIEKQGYEADDLIATYAREAAEIGADVTIISSDKDLMQLINDNVIMYDTMKDRRIRTKEVIEKFGVGPEKMIDLQSLAGDATDNVPGVPGIGPKIAAQLLEEYNTLEELLERAGEIKQNKRRENLIEFADQARLSKRLVTLDQHMPLDAPLDDFFLEPVNGRGLCWQPRRGRPPVSAPCAHSASATPDLRVENTEPLPVHKAAPYGQRSAFRHGRCPHQHTAAPASSLRPLRGPDQPFLWRSASQYRAFPRLNQQHQSRSYKPRQNRLEQRSWLTARHRHRGQR